MLKLERRTPRQFINPLLSRRSITSEELERFKIATDTYRRELESQLVSGQSEPNIVSNALKPYFESLGYMAQSYSQKGQSGVDLALMREGHPAVIVEAKKPDSADMITPTDLNRKALHEAILYFMRERDGGNRHLYHIIVTDFYRWFVFDARDFERLFWQNSEIRRVFESVRDPSVLGDRTSDFYAMVSDRIAQMKANLVEDRTIEAAYFDLSDRRTERHTYALLKLLSPDTLLKRFNPNDANTLDRAFYAELLYLLGLEEVKDGGKKVIQRSATQHSGALYENIVQKLSQHGKPTDFESIIRLMIIWVNRILFLKLLESQLIQWNGSDDYAFLNAETIHDFDRLEMLFFDILAHRPHERAHREFDHIPYLNSSLFEPHAFERKTMMLSSLQDDCYMPYYPKTVLKDAHGKRKEGTVNMLHYLFEFLDAYDFSSEGSEEVVARTKSLINASVLGLIFEKLNGYKDGSFYTPSFITMHMSRETITRAVIDRFNQVKGWDCATLDDLDDRIEDKREANTLINTLTICDPAVGSGHFLVSILNTILEIKSRLRILYDAEGKRIKDYEIRVENDELIVRDDEGEIFEYTRRSREATRIQRMLFHEKQQIIERSLFGVDINPNSAQITRLRLWIELLKNSYYDESGSLVTMPNIDINIKVGNSLISRYGLHDEITIPNIKHAIKEYKHIVRDYKEGDFLVSKKEIRTAIDDLKAKFGLTLQGQWKQTQTYKKVLGEYVKEYGMEGLPREVQLDALDYNYGYHGNLFGDDLTAAQQKAKAKLYDKVIQAHKAIEEIENGKIYEDAFEWRFEFPEVLDDKGNFTGFDVVIGNPPYGVKYDKNHKKIYDNVYSATDDIYTIFIEKSMSLIKHNGIIGLITPIFWLTGKNYYKTRMIVGNKLYLMKGITLPYDVFDDAYVDTGIYFFRKVRPKSISVYEFQPKDQISSEILNNLNFDYIEINDWLQTEGREIIFNKFARNLTKKLCAFDDNIGDITQSTRGILAKSIYYHDQKSSDDDIQVFTGKLDRYKMDNDFKFIYDIDSIKEKPSNFAIFKGERILIRRIVSRSFRIMGSIIDDDFINKKDIYIFKSTNENYSNKYLLAIINSKLMSYYKTSVSTTAKKDDFSQLTLDDIRSISVPKIGLVEQKKYANLVD